MQSGKQMQKLSIFVNSVEIQSIKDALESRGRLEQQCLKSPQIL